MENGEHRKYVDTPAVWSVLAIIILCLLGLLDVPEVPRIIGPESFSQLPTERVGQLYAYRDSPNAVYLGTRNASVFGAAIGIRSIASGKYVCIAQNTNESASINLTVGVRSKASC